MKRAVRFFGLAIFACGVCASGAKADVLAEYIYSDDANFNPMAQGWTLREGTEEDVNFFNAGSNLLINLPSQDVPRPLFSKTVPANAFFEAWSMTGNMRFAGNSQEEFGYFIFADDGTNLWHMSFYNHGNDNTDGIYMGGDPEGPVLGVTATKVWAEDVGAKPFDSFHDWALVDADGSGGAPPSVHLDGVALDPVVAAVPAPSMFPAGTVGWGSLNPFEAGFFQITHIVFEGNPNAIPPELSGDFNGDQTVDGADFVLWQRNLGAPDESALNGNGNDMNGVDQADLALWRSNFGMTASAAAVSAVPEPQTFALLVGGMVASLALRRRR
jgi:hypothetical protein